MATYQKVDSRRFVLQKDAKAWAKTKKAEYVGQKVKVETNYVDGVGMWEAVIRVKA